MDLVGPLQESNGFSYLFTIIDRAFRGLEAVPVKSITAAECARSMLRHWIPFLESLHTSPLIGDHSSHPPFGLCCVLSWELFMLQLHLLHPQSIVLIVECFYRQLKVTLRARLASSDWFHHLPLVLLGLCNVPTDNSPVSAAEVLFGTLLALPGVSQQPPGSF